MTTHKTSHTLLHRALDLKDEDAWKLLVQHYRRFTFYILQKFNVPPDDLEDVYQQVLIELTKGLPTFDSERSKFRTWLSRIISNIAISHYRKRQQEISRKNELTDQEMEIPQAGEIEPIIEEEWSAYIATQAVEQVREIFTGKAAEVFELGLKGYTAEQVAEHTELKVSTVYTLRKRVKKRLYVQIRSLIADLEK